MTVFVGARGGWAGQENAGGRDVDAFGAAGEFQNGTLALGELSVLAGPD